MKRLKSAFHTFIVLTLIVGNFAFLPVPRTAEAVTENSYRWRNDDGSETAATWAAATNTAINLDKGVNKRLRFGVENDGTESQFDKVATSDFGDGAATLSSIVIDASAGFGYGVSNTRPAAIVKFNLSTLATVDTIHLSVGENYGAHQNQLAIDTSNGYLYFGTAASPTEIIKVRLSDFTRLTSLTLNSGENFTGALVLDTANDDLYVGTRTSPAKVVKVDVSGTGLSRTSVVTLPSGDNRIVSGVIDTTSGYTFWGSELSTGEVFSVQYSPSFQHDDTLTLSAGEEKLLGMAINPGADRLYVSTYKAPAKIVEINILEPDAPIRVSALSLSAGEDYANALAYDEAEDKLFVSLEMEALFDATGKVVEVDASAMTRTTSANGNSGENSFGGMAVDATNDLIYVGGDKSGDLVKFDYSTSLARSAGADIYAPSQLGQGAIDTANGFAYYIAGSGSDMNTRVVKVQLSDLSLVDTVEIARTSTDDGTPYGTIIDTTNNFLYFGTSDGDIIKIDLSDFTFDSRLDSTLGGVYNGEIDVTDGFAYFTDYDYPTNVVKIDLSDFSVDSTRVLTGYDGFGYSAIDTVNGTNGYLFLGQDAGTTNQIIRLDLSDFASGSITALDLNADEDYIYSIVIDTDNGFGYAGTCSTGALVKFNSNTMARIGAIDVNDECFWGKPGIDSSKSLAYFGNFTNSTSPNDIFQIDLDAFALEATHSFTTAWYSESFLVDSDNGKGYSGQFDTDELVMEFDITPNPRLRLEYAVKSGSCGASSGWTQVASSSGSGPWKMYDSSYLTHAAATTNTGDGVTDGNTNFLAGEVLDTSSQMSRIALGFDDFTEVEYSIQPTAAATDGATYCFRLTDAGSASGLTYGQYAEATLASSAQQTVVNAATLSRHKIGESSTFALSFDLTGTLSTTTTVTFPSGFTVTGAFTGGTCSGGGTISNFSYTSTTLTADKSGCSGTVTLSGAVITLPGTAGDYVVTWVNDQPGSTIIPVADDDQVTVTASVDPTMTFDLDIATSDSDTDAPYAVALGALGVGSVTGSDDSGINGIWIDLEANASSGAVVQIKNANGTSGLVSASAPGDTIPSLTGENSMSAGTANYGVCVADAGNGVPTASVGTLQEATGIFDGACGTTPGSNAAGGLTTTFTDILDSNSAALAGGRAQIRILAAIADTTVGHDDYADTITLRATGTF